jgi:hypothetical protein
MKKLILAIFLLMASCTPVIAQVSNPKANKVLVVENTGKSKEMNSGYSILDKDDNKTYVVYITSKNKLVVHKVSKKTGKEYNAYLKNIKKYSTQYQVIVKELKKEGLEVQ